MNGVWFPQGLMPRIAEQFGSVALVRSVRAHANVHGLMQTWVQVGRNPATPTARISPHIGSVASLEMTRKRDNPFGRGFEYVPSADRDLHGTINELWA